jgi:hypothetical protein
MKSRTYYGEYNLNFWVRLLLSRELELPDYQRQFIWDDKMVENVLSSLRENLFIPPVTIGRRAGKNFIIDGQQRLTSLLLAKIGKFPILEKFPIEEDGDNKLYKWSYAQLLDYGKNCEEIKSKIEAEYADKYSDFNPGLTNDDFQTAHLGFSFIVPDEKDADEVTRFYSKIFRDINAYGVNLSARDARRSMYYVNPVLAKFFEPECLASFAIINEGRREILDFVRIASFCYQYSKDKTQVNLARGYGKGRKKLEDYYLNFILAINTDCETAVFPKFSEIFNQESYSVRLNSFAEHLNSLEVPKEYTSIIDADIWLIGLTYYVIFEGKKIDVDLKDEIKAKIEVGINQLKSDANHKKSPNELQYIRQRVKGSIDIIKDYIV